MLSSGLALYGKSLLFKKKVPRKPFPNVLPCGFLNLSWWLKRRPEVHPWFDGLKCTSCTFFATHQNKFSKTLTGSKMQQHKIEGTNFPHIVPNRRMILRSFKQGCLNERHHNRKSCWRDLKKLFNCEGIPKCLFGDTISAYRLWCAGSTNVAAAWMLRSDLGYFLWGEQQEVTRHEGETKTQKSTVYYQIYSNLGQS